jgi:hypothetical protein
MWVSLFLIVTHATTTQWRLWNLVQLRNDRVDDEVEFEIKRHLITCKLKFDWNSASHQQGVKKLYSRPFFDYK